MRKNKNNFLGEFIRIIKNCEYYESKGDMVGLTNEIGALRGLSYGYQIYHQDFCPLKVENDFIYYISLFCHIKKHTSVEIIKHE